jgi:uncharacterized protein (DUF1697 family)
LSEETRGAELEGRQVALIRGINVGKAKRVAMADLRALMERHGYVDCRTLLNTGNVIFTAEREGPAESAARIGQAMETELGVAAPVIVLSAAEFSTVVGECSLSEIAENPSRLLVSFLLDPADRQRLEPLTSEEWGREKMALGSRATYLWCPDGVLQSQLPAAVERALGKKVTTRNWKTVQKIQALL